MSGDADHAPVIITEWSLAGQPAVIMENRFVRSVLLPGMGGKIISLVDKRADTELLWRNDRVPLRVAPFGSGYDDRFVGGWDELFPNDEPEVLAGEPFPDHGELWTLPWAVSEVAADDQQAWVELTVRPPISATLVRRRLTLGGGPELRADYRLTNEGCRDLPFLWKSHVAVRLHPDTEISMAARDVLVHEFGNPRVRPPGDTFRWPTVAADGAVHDFRQLPDTPARGVAEFLLATSLERGSCGVGHGGAGSGLTLQWDHATLPSCWLFASYGGGWRGLDVLVLEPCTGYPLSVAAGVAAGTHQVLPAGASMEWSMTARVGRPPAPVTDAVS